MPGMVAVKDEQGLGNMSLELKREEGLQEVKREASVAKSLEREEKRRGRDCKCHVM